MSEEDKKEVQEEQYTEDEQRAIAMGWNPDKEAWVEAGNDPEDYKSARTFIREGEMMDRIGQLGRTVNRYEQEIKTIKESMTKTAKQQAKLIKAERDRLLKTLKRQKVEALKDDDHEAAVEIDDQISQVQKDFDEPEPETNDALENPDAATVQKWIDDNDWYTEDFNLHQEADFEFDKIRRKGEAKTLEEALEKTVARMKQKHPEAFGGKATNNTSTRNRKVLPSRESETKSSSNRSKTYSAKDLNAAEKEMGQEFIAEGIYKDLNEYAQALGKSGYFSE